jgi:uncharacterized sporulation protein YeaH/YhbH (DUF444 family)
VVLFGLDVSASMTDAERKLAKTFFFFVLQGIRRKYGKVETRFIAHTTQAWEFSEPDFFQVTGTGGTGASTAFNLALEMIEDDYDPSQYNIYFFMLLTEKILQKTEVLRRVVCQNFVPC